MSIPGLTITEAERKRRFGARNLGAAVASMLLPGVGHLMRGRRTVGLAWTLFSLAFYGSLIAFRVAADLRLYLLTGIAMALLSCAAVYDCCLRRTPYPASRKLLFVVLAAFGSLIWADVVSYSCSLAAGFRYFVVPSAAMVPTIKLGNHIQVDWRYYKHHKPQNGDIVVMERGDSILGGPLYIVKRVCSVPGERVQIRGNKLIRNGAPVDEPYALLDISRGLAAGWVKDMPERTIPAGELFVLGDNRHNSYDSRAPEVGNYKESELRGKVLRRY